MKHKLNMPLNGDTINADKLSGIDEESDIYEGFSPHVDRTEIVLPDPSPTSGKNLKFYHFALQHSKYELCSVL